MSTSVFLIVAGVLLGPIDADQVWSQCRAMTANAAVCGQPKTESTAETCERVMREMGAERKPAVSDKWETPFHPPAPTGLGGYVLHGQSVLCIPAPTGLRK